MAKIIVNHKQIRFTRADKEKSVLYLNKGSAEIADADLDDPFIKALLEKGAITLAAASNPEPDPEKEKEEGAGPEPEKEGPEVPIPSESPGATETKRGRK